jgi:hypothetical protein
MMIRHENKQTLIDLPILSGVSLRRSLAYSLLTSLWLSFSFFACEGGDEPLILGPQVPETGGRTAGAEVMAGEIMAGEITAGEIMAGEIMAGEIMAGNDNGGTEIEVVCETVVDELRFANEIGPEMIRSCASFGCHPPAGPTPFDLPVDNTSVMSPLEGQLLSDSLAAVMSDPRYIVAGEPQQSLMLSKASNGHGGPIGTYTVGENKYEALASWIESMRQCTEIEVPVGGQEMAGNMAGDMAGDMAGNMAGQGLPEERSEILCNLLPNGDPQQRANGEYYNVFEEQVNGILTTSCGGSGCHASPDNGFWLQAESEPCSVPGNFLMTQAYIDFSNPNTSPILEAPYDPAHSGYTIFTGRTDPRFITIQSWILLAFEE